MVLPNLDDLGQLKRIDPEEMIRLVLEFPEQCEKAVELADRYEPGGAFQDPKQIVVSGLGSSAIAGDMVWSLLKDRVPVPIYINRDYHLPSYVDGRTLVAAVSVSGNTEETLSAYNEAKKAGARLLCITSGGALAEIAEQDGTDLILIPDNTPARASAGYVFIPLLKALEKLEITSGWDEMIPGAINLLKEQRHELGPDVEQDDNRAKELARDLYGRIPMIYGATGIEGVVAERWKDQINLNSKMHAFANYLPEASHNEIDGWEMANMQCESFAVVIVRDPDDKSRVADRIEITKTLIPKGFPLHDVPLEGKSDIEKLLSGFYLADLVSVYLAVLNRIDPSLTTGVEAIKEEMGKVEEVQS